MEKTSSDDLHIRTSDDTVLVVRRTKTSSKTAVLVLPDIGQSIVDMHLSFDQCSYIMELRGHGLSEGRWSRKAQARDVEYVIGLLKQHYRKIIIVAYGLSAGLLLEMEHHLLVDGIVLINPLLKGHYSQRLWTQGRYGHCRVPRAYLHLFCKDLASFQLAPVRVQTPTVIFSNEELYKIFGNMRTHRLAQTSLQQQHQVVLAIKDLEKEEKPIRFAIAKPA